MLAGQAVYIKGQKYLSHVGNLASQSPDPAAAEAARRSLSKEEKDRVFVLLVSFMIVVVFWGAFEQAGGLMNIFTQESTDRMVFGWEIPASTFQSLNPLYIILFAVPVANFWIMWQKKGRESSSLFKMGLGTMIMGWGFIFMIFASIQVENGDKAWVGFIVLAYLFHTIGELCASPVALSFITKLAPIKWASLMMGAYFAATGFGSKLAGMVGEAAVGGLGEKAIFIAIPIFCTVFGGLILLALKPLKAMTHGAEEMSEEKAV